MQNDLSKTDNCTIEVINPDGSVDQSINAHAPNNIEYFKNLAELAVNTISFGSNLAFQKIAGHGSQPKTMYLFNDTVDSPDGYTIRHPIANADGTTQNYAVGVADLYQNYSGVDPNTGSMDYFYCTRKIDFANNKMINTYSVSFGVGKITGKTFNKIGIAPDKDNTQTSQRNASSNSVVCLTSEQSAILGDTGYTFMIDGDTNLYSFHAINFNHPTKKLTVTIKKKDEAMQSNVWTVCGVFTADFSTVYTEPSGNQSENYKATRIAVNPATKQLTLIHLNGYDPHTTNAYFVGVVDFDIPTSAGLEKVALRGGVVDGHTGDRNSICIGVDAKTSKLITFNRYNNYCVIVDTIGMTSKTMLLVLPFGNNTSANGKTDSHSLVMIGDNKFRIFGTADGDAKPVVLPSVIVDPESGKVISADSIPLNQHYNYVSCTANGINDRLFQLYHTHEYSFANGSKYDRHARTSLYLNVPFSPELQFLCIDDVPAVTKESDQYIRIKYEIHSPLPINDYTKINAYFDSIPDNSDIIGAGSLGGFARCGYKIKPPAATLDIAQDDHEQVQVLPIDQEL